jgi:hypothetical protein
MPGTACGSQSGSAAKRNEFAEAATNGYEFVGLTVADTFIAGAEVVCIVRRKATT